MEKEFKKEFEKLMNKYLKKEEELMKELKRSGKYQNGVLDANYEEFKKLHQKRWEEIKELCEKYGVKYEDKK